MQSSSRLTQLSVGPIPTWTNVFRGFFPGRLSPWPATGWVSGQTDKQSLAIVEPPQIELPVSGSAGLRGAHELKFLIDDDRALQIMDWAREHLKPDPHADNLSDAYRVNSLYLDSPNLEVYHRCGQLRRRKYRLRRYGSESIVWFELKGKHQGCVVKRRAPSSEAQVEHVLLGSVEEPSGTAWFRTRVDRRSLLPVCQVTYQRFARIGTTPHGTMRLTIDHDLSGCLANGWDVPDRPLAGIPLLEGQRVLELKFQGDLPDLFRRLLHEQGLQFTSFSKYRTAVEECVPLDCIAGDVPLELFRSRGGMGSE